MHTLSSGRKKSSESVFWIWFEYHQDMLFHFEADQETVFELLACQLHRVHPHLTFEFGPIENGQREFVISAGGIVSAFPVVHSLVDAAPPLPKWKIISFRPRRRSLDIIRINNTSVNPDDVTFSLQPHGHKINVVLFFGDDNMDQTLRNHLGFLLLDTALGEYDVETYVDHVDFLPGRSTGYLRKLAFRNLPGIFDNLIKTASN